MQCTPEHSTEDHYISLYTTVNAIGLLHISYVVVAICIKTLWRKGISIFRREIFPQSIFLKDIKGKYTLTMLFPSPAPYNLSWRFTRKYATNHPVHYFRSSKMDM